MSKIWMFSISQMLLSVNVLIMELLKYQQSAIIAVNVLAGIGIVAMIFKKGGDK